MGFLLCFVLAATARAPAEPSWQKTGPASGDFRLSGADEAALQSILPDALRNHLAYLASDALGGRRTPSQGLEIAAEYIASQFKRAGLDPIGDTGYFQTCRVAALTPNPEGFRFSFDYDGKTVEVSPEHFQLDGIQQVQLNAAPILKVAAEKSSIKHLRNLSGKVVFTEFRGQDRDNGPAHETSLSVEEFRSRLAGFGPALLVVVDRSLKGNSGYFSSSVLLADKEHHGRHKRGGYPAATVSDPALIAAYDAMNPGETGARLTLQLLQPITKDTELKNVLGLLRGSDSQLKDTFVVLSAHYDGIGPAQIPGIEPVAQAANDNASGTASVMEIARALSMLQPRPRRSVVFAAFYGEEEGSLGARCYIAHPAVPLEQTIVDLNLEQMGRTDSTLGDRKKTATVTGLDYSTIGSILKKASSPFGITIAGSAANPDPYFERSDNLPFAEKGIPAHTICVALEFPGYHGTGDTWEKIDYENMAITDRMVAMSILLLSQQNEIPHWAPLVPQGLHYLRAAKEAGNR